LSLLRRFEYSGEFATRITLALRPGSRLITAATRPRSMSGSAANSMICRAIAGGLGKFTASISFRCSGSSISR